MPSFILIRPTVWPQCANVTDRETGQTGRTTDIGRKFGGLWGGGPASPSNTLWPGPRPTCMPSFILMRPTVWPQCANVTDRQTGQTGQRTDSIGRTVLQTAAQKSKIKSFLEYGSRTAEIEVSRSDAAIKIIQNVKERFLKRV